MDTESNIPDMEEVDYLSALLLKQLRQEITDAELQYLENWKAAHPSHARVSEQVNDSEQLLAHLLSMKQIDMEGWWQKISEQIETVKKPVPLYRRWYTYAAAAVVLLIAGAITWQYLTPPKLPKPVNEKYIPAVVNVLPGGNKATLTLSSGAVINLGHASNGTVAEEGNSKIIKLKDGELKYERKTRNEFSNGMMPGLNSLSTPRGGQYTLVLPDGSKVWLNAASSITYPTQFATNERKVTITGEAYFDVVGLPSTTSHKGEAKKIPFIVAIQSAAGNNLAQVKVLGTQFNIMAYDNEAAIKTTLVNGKVMVSLLSAANQTLPPGATRLLTPGQQAQIPQRPASATVSDPIKVVDMEDVEDIAGWKNGYVSLKNADIKYIMRMISRWYNVEVDYQEKAPAYTFSGTLPLKQNLSTVIKMLEFEGVHFKQVQNKIVVMP